MLKSCLSLRVASPVPVLRVSLHPSGHVFKGSQYIYQNAQKEALSAVQSPSLGGFTFTRIVFQVPAWSCSWDLNNSHYIYAGLQNGSVLVFDMRQTAGPMKSLVGFTSNPVHTVHALAQTSSLSSGVKTILSASVVGLFQWNIDSEER
ncbi:hypothetical protein JHK85_028139 [Glycine max]|nr:hypothetical protein JHK85_028139 [Glycine max]